MGALCEVYLSKKVANNLLLKAIYCGNIWGREFYQMLCKHL